jgi:LCP family protein required for cell wall assembly
MKKTKKTNKTSKKMGKKLLFFNFVLFSILLLASIFFVYTMYNTRIVPDKYLILVSAVLLVFLVTHFVLTIKRKKVFSIILDILLVLIVAVECLSIPKMGEFIDFIKYNFNAQYDVSVYNIMVSTKSEYNSIEDLKGKDIILFNETEGDELINQINNRIPDNKITNTEDIMGDLTKLKKDKTMIVICDSSYYETQVENDLEFENSVKVLDTIEIKVKIDKKDSKNINVTKNSFVVYISGIDTRSNSMPTRSLSDVNILMAVNPDTKKILLVHTPRDYYVQLHGTTGLKDKLTHAGTKKGGINSSIATIEDLYDSEIPFYIRVNFQSVIKVVDAIGGINIYNDQNYTVKSYVDDTCSYKPGWNNNVKGKCALAFARERHAYKTGDKHRGENQEQVITRIIEKVSSSTVLLNKYSDILKSLNNSFETNMDADKITSLVKMQVNDMAKWNIDSYNVTGTGAMEYTYSYPHQKLYVMKPNMETVETAKQKIKEVLG